MEHWSFQPIGFIESCFPTRFGTPRQAGLAPDAWGVLRLRPELNLGDGLDGLEAFSHAWLVFVFHRNENRRPMTKVAPPRLGGEKMGVFATRSPHRPNPIGLSAVRIERIEGNTVYFSGVDLLDGTPVLDLKPYVPFADALPDARAEWAPSAPPPSLDVHFDQEAEAQLERFRPESERREKLRRLIAQSIALDPRAGYLKGTAERPNPYTDRYGIFLEELNVVFRVEDNRASVALIESAEEMKARKSNAT